VFLDFPVRPRPRYGYGRPPHAKLEELIGAGRDRYARELEACLAFRPWLDRIAMSEPPESPRPAWVNGFLPGWDSATLYSFVARRNPPRYLEVGSGNSTKFVRRAIQDHGLRTRIESVDPEPRADVQAIADVLTRQPLERVDLSLFQTLEAGDILFIDSSHRCFMNSDVTVAFLEILPSLANGVLVHFHDICLPYDYPPGTEGEYYSEQYVLAAYLLGGARRAEIVLPNAYASADPALRTVLDPLWNGPGREAVERRGSSFWMEMTGERDR
jgi:hypothetical protein